MTPTYELSMEQGADWTATINWYGGGIFRAPIEEIDMGYPTNIRVSAHQLPSSSDTPVIISGVQGAEILNSSNTAIELVTRVDADYFTVPISTVACEWVVGTGEITYHLPTDLSTFTGRCQLRKSWNSSTVIADLTTQNNGMTLTGDDGSIQLDITSAVTTGLNFVKAYGDIEVIAPGGLVTRVARIIVEFSREHSK